MKKLLAILFSTILGVALLFAPFPSFTQAAPSVTIQEQIDALEQRVSNLELSERQTLLPSRITSLSTFSGQGSTQTLPFRIDSYPCRIQLEIDTDAQSIFWIRVQDPTKPELHSIGVARHFWLVMKANNPTYETVSYVLPGIYYLEIETGSWVE